MKIKEFPLDWSRNVDLVTPLTLQIKLNPKQEVFYLKGRASEQTAKVAVVGEEPIEVEGVKIYPYDTFTRSYPVEFGVPNPEASEERKSLKEIWDIVTKEVAAPDCVIQERACIHEPPKKVPDKLEDIVSGVDEFYQVEQSKGWRRRVAGLPCVSVQKMMKAELTSKDIVKLNDPAFKRMRGVLLTAFILPAVKVGKVINLKGWNIFGNNENSHSLQRVLRAPKFWQDTALPWKVEVDPFDHTVLRGFVYRLESRNKLLGV
jgi:hypothetical protein